MVGGRVAVTFFCRSQIDRAVLREARAARAMRDPACVRAHCLLRTHALQVWNIANPRQLQALDFPAFCVALRLICLVQVGQRVHAGLLRETAAQFLPPPLFEKVPSPPMAVVQAAVEEACAAALWRLVDPQLQGVVQGKPAVDLFLKSGLSRSVLREVRVRPRAGRVRVRADAGRVTDGRRCGRWRRARRPASAPRSSASPCA